MRYQLLCSGGAVPSVLLELPTWRPNKTWATSSSPSGPCLLRCMGLRWHQARRKAVVDAPQTFHSALPLAKGIPAVPGTCTRSCRHLRTWRYWGVAQELEFGKERCFGCKFTAVFYGEEKSSWVLFRAGLILHGHVKGSVI